MNVPDIQTLKKMDAFMQSNYCFALYRLPWTDECMFVVQKKGDVETLGSIHELNGKRGFVVAPFRLSEAHPLLMIRPDECVLGWEAIGNVLNSLFPTSVAIPAQSVVPTEADDYAEVFESFIEPLRENKFRKLVLSRTENYILPDDFSLINTFIKACNQYPRMMIYLCHTPSLGTWMGSTPEILLSGSGKEWHTVALAGTMSMQGNMMPENWTEKNQEEQAMVADYVRSIVNKFGGKKEEKGPYTARAGQLVHLKTDFYFQLKKTNNLGDLLSELHPTPAVCGLPKKEAYEFIHLHESHDRKYYTGFIGWLNPDGQTDLYVNLRCMEIHGKVATLYAGGGILPSSDVAQEWEETREKMKTMKNILS